MQSWATSLHILLQLVQWWQNLSSRLYYLLWPQHYLQNKETHHLFFDMIFVVELPLLDVPSFWALVCLSWQWPSPCHPHQQQGVCSVVPLSPSQRWCRDSWRLCCQHSWSRLRREDPMKSGISHRRTHHVLASTSWTPERDKKEVATKHTGIWTLRPHPPRHVIRNLLNPRLLQGAALLRNKLRPLAGALAAKLVMERVGGDGMLPESSLWNGNTKTVVHLPSRLLKIRVYWGLLQIRNQEMIFAVFRELRERRGPKEREFSVVSLGCDRCCCTADHSAYGVLAVETGWIRGEASSKEKSQKVR